jgi:hypothetical protein
MVSTFEQASLLRVYATRLGWSNGEEWSIKCGDIFFEEMGAFDVDLIKL